MTTPFSCSRISGIFAICPPPPFHIFLLSTPTHPLTSTTTTPPHPHSGDDEQGPGLQLRDYQWEGVRWMLFNWSQKRNSILADEMGT